MRFSSRFDNATYGPPHISAETILRNLRDPCARDFVLGGDRRSRAAQRLLTLYHIPFHLEHDTDVVIDIRQLPPEQLSILARLAPSIMNN
jgi:hypothetical protein